jgi:hypothetical protein
MICHRFVEYGLRMIVPAVDPKTDYFPTTIRLGRHFKPAGSYIAVRLGAAEGLLSGIATVHDWSHTTVTPEHAAAWERIIRRY